VQRGRAPDKIGFNFANNYDAAQLCSTAINFLLIKQIVSWHTFNEASRGSKESHVGSPDTMPLTPPPPPLSKEMQAHLERPGALVQVEKFAAQEVQLLENGFEDELRSFGKGFTILEQVLALQKRFPVHFKSWAMTTWEERAFLPRIHSQPAIPSVTTTGRQIFQIIMPFKRLQVHLVCNLSEILEVM